MNSSFYNGISGTKTHQFGMDVWADNIANVNTYGFKSATPEFSTIFATTLTGNYFDGTTNNIGLGSRPSSSAIRLEQGTLQPSDNVFDLALTNEGWFGVQGGANQLYYTRAGLFTIDNQNRLVDPSGNYLLGTLGNNITPTTLPQQTMLALGQYYSNGQISLGQAYSIQALGNVALGPVDTQMPITLPDKLYLPPEPTTKLSYQANLNPEIITETAHLVQNNLATPISVTQNGEILTLSGTFENATGVSNAKAGDKIVLKVLDQNNKALTLEAMLDENLQWSIPEYNISALDTSRPIGLDNEIKLVQEIPNMERFTTDIIAPDGSKDLVNMVFTKRVPQESLQTVWDGVFEILRYEEPYIIETYDPNRVYDPAVYNVDLQTRQVTKIYDPEDFYIDTGSNKVYRIIDRQTGNATFGGGGELLQNTLPTLSNSGQPLALNLGEPYATTPVTVGSTVAEGNNLIITGTAPNIEVGKSVRILIENETGRTILASAVVQEGGTWRAVYENNPFDQDATLTSSAYHVVHSGYEGMISHVDLEKGRVAQKDGHPEGFLKAYGMDGNGNVIAEFSNGRSSAVAKVAVYHFQNDQGLTRTTSTLFQASSNSGEAIFYTNENGEFILGSSILSNYLESSNVNLATALTELIVMQKAFSGNAKSITTSDEMIQNAIQMKK